jgi:hypothetical protein
MRGSSLQPPLANRRSAICAVAADGLARWHRIGIGPSMGERFETRQPYGRLGIRIPPHVNRIVLEMQEAEALARLAVGRAPAVKGEEF